MPECAPEAMQQLITARLISSTGVEQISELEEASGMVAYLLETQLRSLYQWPALIGYAQLLRRPLHDAVHAAVDAILALEDLDHLGERHRRRAPYELPATGKTIAGVACTTGYAAVSTDSCTTVAMTIGMTGCSTVPCISTAPGSGVAVLVRLLGADRETARETTVCAGEPHVLRHTEHRAPPTARIKRPRTTTAKTMPAISPALIVPGQSSSSSSNDDLQTSKRSGCNLFRWSSVQCLIDDEPVYCVQLPSENQ
eukprot:CAMPEP_0118818004 /NCGR_PEP_ID=MMETSP1162-20130426/5813_1 /TAXON_ID=33656 /ORGANISM="Phaeocystis Sp, Strain CCMP2710" /LENGTH=254 /DNA_ID=CAMNT_0006748153 /DNA_START=67 /DNA_END=833 /DNA_ORIENTATION=+